MSFQRSIIDTFLQWTATAEAECRAFRKFPDDVKYRLYAEADEADCISIYRALETEFPAEGIQPFLDCLRCPENNFIVAERAGRVIGLGGISLTGRNVATLYYGLVAPGHQGLGIGTALTLLRLCSLPPGEIPPTVFIWTLEKSQAFYHRFGFTTHTEWQDSNGGRHPGAHLDLAGFRPSFVRKVLRRRNVVLEGDLKPRQVFTAFLDKIRRPDGTIEYRAAIPDDAVNNRGTDPG